MKTYKYLILILFALISRTIIAENIYVSAKVGNDTTGNGSFDKPYKTISKAVSIAKSGDICFIREGIYREKIVPTNDNLTIKAYKSEKVIVSGCDQISRDWGIASHNSNIKTNSISSRILQVFIGETRMNLARFPNEDANQDMLDWNEWASSTTKSVSLEGAGIGEVVFDESVNLLDEGVNTWVGGQYMGRNGYNPFNGATGKIVASKGNSLTVKELSFYWKRVAKAASNVGKGKGYIINHIKALDHSWEWYHSKEGTFYFYPPEGVDIATTPVDARVRLWGLDASNRKNIVVDGIHFFAASVKMSDSENCVLRKCHIEYPAPWTNAVYGDEANNTDGHDYGDVSDGSTGVFVSGNNNLVDECWIEKSWGSGIRLEGTNNTIKGSLIEDVDWITRRMNGIQAFGLKTKVLNNTVRRCGQAGIDGGNRSIVKKLGTELTIKNNIIEQAGVALVDCGAFYINAQGGVVNSEVAYNLVKNSPDLKFGLYSDNHTNKILIHHNLCLLEGVKIGVLSNNGKKSGDDTDIYNNTILNTSENAIKLRGLEEHKDCFIHNNLTDDIILTEGSGGVKSNNISDATKSIFVNAKDGDYRIKSSYNEAIDKGIVFKSDTYSYTGSQPDIGAFESGQPIWSAGSWVNAKILSKVGKLVNEFPVKIIASKNNVLADFTIIGGAMGQVPVTLNNVPSNASIAVFLYFNGSWATLSGIEGENMGGNDYNYKTSDKGTDLLNYNFNIQRATVDVEKSWRIKIVNISK